MTRLHQWWNDRHARRAARYLANRRIQREREAIRAKARSMREAFGLPPHRGLA